jgi:hypothetical protein
VQPPDGTAQPSETVLTVGEGATAKGDEGD